MATNALTCSGSPLMSNRGTRAPSRVGFGPNQHRSLMLGRASSRGLSLVVRAQDDPPTGPAPGQVPAQGPGGGSSPVPGQGPTDPSRTKPKIGQYSNKPALLGSFRYVRDPWKTLDDEEKVVIKVDLPDLTPNDINVRIEGKKLIIVDTARKTLNDEIAFLLPDECLGTKNPKAKLDKKGVLTVTLDKVIAPDTIQPILISVESINDI